MANIHLHLIYHQTLIWYLILSSRQLKILKNTKNTTCSVLDSYISAIYNVLELNIKIRKVNQVAKNITIFTTNTCAYCVMVKKWLTAKGLSYEEVNLDQNPERQKEAFEASGQMAVPVTIVTKEDDSKEVVVGYNLAKLAPAVS